MKLLLLAVAIPMAAACAAPVTYQVVDPNIGNDALMAMPAPVGQTESEAIAVLKERPVSRPAGYDEPSLEVLHSKFPGYPKDVISDEVEGVVELTFIVNEAGRVQDLEVTASPDPRLSAECVSAMSQWRFRPPMKGGVATRVKAMERFPFRLR